MVSTNVIVSEGNTVNPGNSRGLSDEGKRKMSSNFEHAHEENEDYGKKFRPDREIYVVKKDGSKELFNVQKVISAVGKSAYRALTKFTREEKEQICRHVVEKVNELEVDEVPIPIMHNIVESALEQVKPVVAKSYRDYRNYKQDFVRMLDDVYKKSQSIMYIGDKENANTDSALVSTKRSLIFNQLNKELYQKFFLTTEEIQACRDGYIYVHDMSARRDTMNCCLFDVQSVLTGGFEMGNIWYNEPKTLDVAFDVIGDIVLSAASQQYGGFTVPSVDLILEPYAEKSYNRALAKYERLGIAADVAEAEALADVQKEFEQGFHQAGGIPLLLELGVGGEVLEFAGSVGIGGDHSHADGRVADGEDMHIPGFQIAIDHGFAGVREQKERNVLFFVGRDGLEGGHWRSPKKG